MFKNLTLKSKLLALTSAAFLMILFVSVFGLLELWSAMQNGVEQGERINLEIKAMNEISSMEIHFLKEVKLAKDVWIRGANAENHKKYRDEYTAQQEEFGNKAANALADLKDLAPGNSEAGEFVTKLNTLITEHLTCPHS